MKNKELIALLQTLDPELEVKTKHYDELYGPYFSAVVDAEETDDYDGNPIIWID